MVILNPFIRGENTNYLQLTVTFRKIIPYSPKLRILTLIQSFCRKMLNPTQYMLEFIGAEQYRPKNSQDIKA